MSVPTAGLVDGSDVPPDGLADQDWLHRIHGATIPGGGYAPGSDPRITPSHREKTKKGLTATTDRCKMVLKGAHGTVRHSVERNMMNLEVGSLLGAAVWNRAFEFVSTI